MLNFTNKNKEYISEIKQIFKSIDFESPFHRKSLELLPNIEFDYIIDNGSLSISGPKHSFFVRKPYTLQYDINKNILYLNNEELKFNNFSTEYHTIKKIYKALIKRNEDIKEINGKLKNLSNSVKITNSNISNSSNNYKNNKQHNKNNRNNFINTDFFTSSVSDSDSRGSSRDKDSSD